MTYIDENGYRRFYDSDRLVSRWAASKKLGRYVHSWEVVHHIDRNKRNNNQNNLYVCTEEEHDRIHRDSFRNYGKW